MNIEKYKKDIKSLIKLGNELMEEFSEAVQKRNKKDPHVPKFFSRYQGWYTESCAIIQQLLSSRLVEFNSLYHSNPKRKSMDITSYSIQDWVLGLRSGVNKYTSEKLFDDAAVVLMKFQTQLEILKSIEKRFESSLFDIRHLVQADIFDNELDAAEELLKKGFARATGAVAGVVLEGHLETVCENHNVKISKTKPTISDYNDALKNSDVIDTATWRRIQFLGDIRNNCDHKKKDDPRKEEIEDLIDGVKKIMKNIF